MDDFEFLGTRMRLHASQNQTAGRLGAITQDAPAGFTAPPHVHHREDEAFYVISGNVTFHRGERVIEAGPGAFVWLPRDVPHWFRVANEVPAKLLQLNAPAGLERFFIDVASAPATPPDIEWLAATAARFGIELLPQDAPPPRESHE